MCKALEKFTCSIDQQPFMSFCKQEVCRSMKIEYQNFIKCNSMAAYAFECAKSGSMLNGWISDTEFSSACFNSNYGRCSAGTVYSDCVRTCNSTCQDLSIARQLCELDCVQGLLSSTSLNDFN